MFLLRDCDMESSQARRILFVCTGNTCRSLMAEYLANHRSDPASARFESAGIRLVPSEDTGSAVRTLRSLFGIDASGHIPRELEQVDLSVFSLVVAIDDPGSSNIYKFLKEKGFPTETLIRWKVDNPYGDDATGYERCALKLTQNLADLQRKYRIE